MPDVIYCHWSCWSTMLFTVTGVVGQLWVTVACFSSSQCLSFHHLQYEAMKTGDVESLVMRLLHWQTNLPLLAARIRTAVSNGLQKERLMER